MILNEISNKTEIHVSGTSFSLCRSADIASGDRAMLDEANASFHGCGTALTSGLTNVREICSANFFININEYK